VLVEELLLRVKGSIVPIPVQAGFAESDNLGPIHQGHDPIPIAWTGLRAAVGLDADRCEDAAIFERHPLADEAGISGRCDGDDPLHARRAGAR
jgi:hypothetical protein